MKFAQDIIIDSEPTSASIESEAVLLDQIYGYAMQCEFTGTPSGTLKLQASCEIIRNGDTGPTIWTDVDGSSTAISASGTVLYNADAQFYKYVRIVYSRLSGTGTLKVTYNSKG